MLGNHCLDYEQALDFWTSRINFEEREPAREDLHLAPMRALLDLLGNPQQRLRIIHVAGSKGKGSTCAMLASILQHAKYRTGLFTSPHLSQIEERIQVDGQPLSRDELTLLLNEIHSVLDSPDGRRIQPTCFEMATALGFLHFARRQVDAAVIEVGLGGRLDSTNVCDPVLAVMVMSGGNFESVADLEEKLGRFVTYFNTTMASPMTWTYTGKPTQSQPVARFCPPHRWITRTTKIQQAALRI